jgi:hypothetical protein
VREGVTFHAAFPNPKPMTLTLDDAIAPAVRQDIESRLDAIEAEEDVRLLLAVESGSRAWGFPSPDSDYDVRFVYVRDCDWYLRLRPGRDVVERPILDHIDLNGWDVRKTLDLLLRSNAVIGEWIDSPIRYRPDDPVIAALRSLADDVIDARALAHHYSRLGRNAAERWLEGGDPVPVKRYFYALRPALAIRSLRLAPDMRPPMNLQALVVASEVPEEVAAHISALVEAKRQTNELANGMRMPVLDRLIRTELQSVSDVPPKSRDDDVLLQRAEHLFRELVNR